MDRDASKDAAQVEYYLTSFEAAVHWILRKVAVMMMMMRRRRMKPGVSS